MVYYITFMHLTQSKSTFLLIQGPPLQSRTTVHSLQDELFNIQGNEYNTYNPHLLEVRISAHNLGMLAASEAVV